MSFRKNAFIAISIIIVCMVLITQTVGNREPQKNKSRISLEPAATLTQIQADQTDHTVRLTAVVHMDQAKFQAFSERNDKLFLENPGIQVQVTNLQAEDVFDYYKEQARMGTSPDIMLLNNEWVNEFAASGYLSHQLEKFIRVKKNNVDDLIRWNGFTWAVHFEDDPYVIVSSAAVYEELFSDVPQPATIEEWMAFREQRGAEGKQSGLIYIDPSDPYAFISLIWAFGGQWSMAEEGMYQLTGRGEHLLELLYGLSSDEKLSLLYPLVHTEILSEEEKWSRFEDGSIPIMIVRSSELEDRDPSKWQQIPSLVEQSNASEALWLAGTSFAVASTSEYPTEAFTWLNSMIGNGGNNENEAVVGRSLSPEPDPELLRKMDVLQDTVYELYNGTVFISEMNNRLSQRWVR